MAEIVDFAAYSHQRKRDHISDLVEKALQHCYESGNLAAAAWIEAAKADAAKDHMVEFYIKMDHARKILLSVHRV